ncbi:MAG: amino-acid N-acetyltransferase [Succinivibrionaceae bacterium]
MARHQDQELVNAIRHSAPYVNMHANRTFVILLGGDTLLDSHVDGVISDIAILQSLGIKLVVVFGAKPQIDEALSEAGIVSKFHRHIRIADDESFKIIKRVCGALQLDLTARFSMGITNTPMQGSKINVINGNFVTAKPIGVIDGIDFCHSGSVRRVNKREIKDELDRHNIVLISPVGVSVTGENFSVNAEDMASRIAIELKADKFITFSSFRGVLDEEGNVVPELFLDQAENYLMKLGVDDFSATARYLRAAIASCKAGVPRSHLVSHTEDGALLQELFTRDGIGTQIVQESAEQCVPATINDIGSLMDLIRPMEQAGILIHRSKETLELEIDHYMVIKRDGMVIGSVALYCYDNNMAELACLAIHPNYRNSNRADLLIDRIIQRAREQNITRIFVLTTSTAHFFLERGFVEGTVDDLPAKKASKYNYNRNSKIFIRDI